jgi:hypothetical protein
LSNNQLFFAFGVDNVSVNYTAAGIPEPGTWLLLARGLISLGLLRRRRSAGTLVENGK